MSDDGAGLVANRPSSLESNADGTHAGNEDSRTARFGTLSEKKLSVLLLAEANEIESRLRQHCLELLEPTVGRQLTQERILKEVRISLECHVEEMSGVKHVEGLVQQCLVSMDGFRVELAEWDQACRSQEHRVGIRLSGQETDIQHLRQLLNTKSADWSAFRRTLKGLGEEIGTARQEVSELRRYCCERADQNRDKIVKLRADFEKRMTATETDIEHLRDYSTRTSAVSTQRMDTNVENATAIVNLQRSKASVECVEEQQRQADGFTRHMAVQLTSLKERFETLVDDLKQHFVTSSEVIGASTGQQMDEFRAKAAEELDRSNAARAEMRDFVTHQRLLQGRLEGEVGETYTRVTASISELHMSLQDAIKVQVADRKSIDVELTQLRTMLREVEAAMQRQSNIHSARKDVLDVLLETQLLSVALDRQDEVDKRSIALFGIKDPAKTQGASYAPDKAHQLPDLANPRSSASRAPRKRQGDCSASGGPSMVSPVVSIDKRCLSCSGSAATQLAGFKMACLQYTPTPVEYGQEVYVRSELINLQLDLLKQAKEQVQCLEQPGPAKTMERTAPRDLKRSA
eukprot:NODE_3505_length_2026_cov_7.953660.p1 GENE.NODE_3505_length_2026_cov_7.953660~~NODE_3505_length_2026_cov_7.953660.p1  ORF type:complete len:575 (-),score=100.36 NODE_3505_length_2026_cov_7.953660:181-1905(-)